MFIEYILLCSGVDVFTAIAGAVGALYGPLHGGANEVPLTPSYKQSQSSLYSWSQICVVNTIFMTSVIM